MSSNTRPRTTRDVDSVAVIAKWIRRCGLPFAILACLIAGVLLGAPTLRLRGDYLAIVTLGFGEIARVLITSDWWSHLVGGAQGLRDVTDAHIGPISFQNPKPFYYLALAVKLTSRWRRSNARS